MALRPLLLLPFVGLLIVPLFNREEPSLLGFPFFYWYLFAWVPRDLAADLDRPIAANGRRTDAMNTWWRSTGRRCLSSSSSSCWSR